MLTFDRFVAHMDRYFTAWLTIILVVCFVLFVGLPVFEGACPAENTIKAGFGKGLAHGFLLVISLIWSLVDGKTGIYQMPNTGAGYNIGFFLGIVLWYGIGLAGQGKKANNKNDENNDITPE